MSLEAKPFVIEEHYEIVKDWWSNHKGWVPVPLSMLPPTGRVIYDGDKPVAAGFLIKSDCAIVALEYIVTNPQERATVRVKALDVLVESLLKEVKPHQVVFTWLENHNLIKKFKQHGFVLGDQNITSVLRVGGI